MFGQDSLKTRRSLKISGKSYEYYSLAAAEEAGFGDISRLPQTLKILLENLLRWEDGGYTVSTKDAQAIAHWLKDRRSDAEINYRPARVLMQDFTGVPAVVDLAAMRDAIVDLGGDATKINPLSPVDLVIDHSVMIDYFGSDEALKRNTDMEFQRNQERYAFLRWGQKAFDNFRVVPPGTGICHQVNVEHLARVVWQAKDGETTVLYPDSCVGTDSHTTMVNGLAVLGWGVGGIEAEAVMLGQPVSMLVPEVVGFRLTGRLAEGVTATDLVLQIVEMLREKGVVGKFVEFFGAGLDNLALPDRATIANMAPEYGATCGFFPIDRETVRYLEFTGRDGALVEAYARAQGLWREEGTPDPIFSDTMELDISQVQPAISGPKRPQDRILLSQSAAAFEKLARTTKLPEGRAIPIAGKDHALRDGDVVIAAITSCTNTSNPNVLIAAGLLAKKARARGLMSKPWVKTSLAPGSQVVADYLAAAGLQEHLDALGFHIAGFGCTTCIGNSGPLDAAIAEAIDDNDMTVTAVLSGNRNFEGRISPHVKANYLASPPLVVAYAIAGSMTRDLYNDPLGKGDDGAPVYLRDIWPGNDEIKTAVQNALTAKMFRERYADVFKGTEAWRNIAATESLTYDWDRRSTYVQNPPYFDDLSLEVKEPEDITGARLLARLGDSVTTDHISPAGSIAEDGPAGTYLMGHQVRPAEFNSYGARRGNHKVMMRGTFANIRIRNELAPGTEGGHTRHQPSGEQLSIYDAAMRYAEEGVPLVVVGGKEYGTGSSRDWAAKGVRLLGVKAVLVESFERIHRTNLVCMGVLPLQFMNGENRDSLSLDGTETLDILGLSGGITPRQEMTLRITRADGSRTETRVLCRIDTENEVDYFKSGGILSYVLQQMV